MLYGNYVVIMIMFMSIYVDMYVCRCLTGSWLLYANDYIYVCMYEVAWQGHQRSLLFYVDVYIYVPMLLSNRIIKNYSRGGMIAYACEWYE